MRCTYCIDIACIKVAEALRRGASFSVLLSTLMPYHTSGVVTQVQSGDTNA